MKVPGVYIIRNKINSKIYVGMAIDSNRRLKYHKYSLLGNYHKNHYLQNAWNKYGEESFEFDILEECSEELLPAMEHYWATLLNSHNRDFGYNIEPTNPTSIGRVMSEESRIKIGLSQKDKKLSSDQIARISLLATERMKNPQNRDRIRRIISGKKKSSKIINGAPDPFRTKLQKIVFQYDLDGNFIKEWECLSVVAYETNICKANICKCLTNQRTSAGGYIWKY